MSQETMGQKLQKARQAAGMSQSQLAAVADVPIGTLRNWEQDRRTPLLDTAARVAKALGVSVDALAGVSVPPGEVQPHPRGRPRKAQAAAQAAPAKKPRAKARGA
jgi:transcriptional regulator with XRE-family HTH domain